MCNQNVDWSPRLGRQYLNSGFREISGIQLPLVLCVYVLVPNPATLFTHVGKKQSGNSSEYASDLDSFDQNSE